MSIPAALEKQILATIVYYDILDYPLTAFEVFLYFINNNKKLGNWEIGKLDKNFLPCRSFSAEPACRTGRDSDKAAVALESLSETPAERNNINMAETRQRLVSADDNINNNGKEDISGRNNFLDIVKLLNSSEYLEEHIDQKLGFYFLKSRGNNPPSPLYQGGADIVRQRLERKKLADWKWKKARKIFWIMQIAPFVKMVLVSGSLALGNSKENSDIDLIITAKKGRIWTVRTFITLLASLLGARRHGDKTKNKICLNHYITDQSLKIPFESLYNAQSYVHLVNVYDSEEDKELFRKFQKENMWIKKYIPNYGLSRLGNQRSIGRNKALDFVSKFFEFVLSGKIGNSVEKKLSDLQSGRIKKDPLCGKRGGRIIINDDQLEFHPDSHESYIIPEFNKRMKGLGLCEFANQTDSGLNR